MFKDRKLLIATKHQKEKAIAPVFTKSLGVQVIVPAQLDTDVFGTFTGEITRTTSAIAAARKKIDKAFSLYDCDMAIASEGSFGSHPTFGFVAADEEVLLFIDKKNNLEISISLLSTNTNYNSSEITTEEQLNEFVVSIGFPKHGVILRKNNHELDGIIKGIRKWDDLKNGFEKLMKGYGSVICETDMRAMHNPTRMKVIEEAAKKLVKKIRSTCVVCQTPGFDVTRAVIGLPCSYCGTPTKSTLAYERECQHCGFKNYINYPHGKQFEDQMYCDNCNP